MKGDVNRLKPPSPPERKPRTIVGEVTLNWPREDAVLISTLFEVLCRDAERRGYSLKSWNMCQLSPTPGSITETIVAVFEEAST